MNEIWVYRDGEITLMGETEELGGTPFPVLLCPPEVALYWPDFEAGS